MKAKSPDEAEALREQRLLAIVLGKSKTDVRLIDADFTDRYMKGILPESSSHVAIGVKIPGTSITAAPPSQKVEALRLLTNQVLQARAIELAPGVVTAERLAQANEIVVKLDVALDGALTQAGKQGRVIKKRFAAADRLSDANENLELAIAAVSDARSTGNFDPDDLDEVLVVLKVNIGKLAQLVVRGSQGAGDGLAWLRAAASLPVAS